MKIIRRSLFSGAIMGLAATYASKVSARSPSPASDAEDLAVCRDIVVRTSMFMDANDTEHLLPLLTADFEFVRPSTWPNVAFRGHDAFRKVLAERPANFVSRHLFTNMMADRLDSENVRVRSYFTHYNGTRSSADPEAPVPIGTALRSMGEYDDRLRLVGNRWLLARRAGHFIFGGL